jgi:hypothetical protein
VSIQDDQVPADFRHSEAVWERMYREATVVPSSTEGEAPMLVYEGFLSRLITAPENQGGLNLSNPYYSKCTTILTRMGCVRQLKRGGGSGTSQWQLLDKPKLEVYFDKVQKRGVGSGRKNKTAQLEDQLMSVISRQNRLEELLVAQGTIDAEHLV